MKIKKAFTLVEMLVSSALVLLIMLLFAQVFQTVTRVISQQKGLAENNSKARMILSIMRTDIDKRTFKFVMPFAQGTKTINLEKREGYFHIGEGDPDDNTDDVLQFTISLVKKRPQDVDEFMMGKATLLMDPSSADPGTQTIYLSNHPNQPEFDDGNPFINGSGQSHYAEICYFLRAGKLYRRVLLIREPYSNDAPFPFNIDEIPNNYDVSVAPNGTGFFWMDFDYSAYNSLRGASSSLKFHNPKSLENAFFSAVGVDIPYPISLGIPHLRYGSSLRNPAGAPTDTIPFRRKTDGTIETGSFHIGRFTTQETAHGDFQYPGTNQNNPFVRNDLVLGTDGRMEEFDGPDRRGDDILLSGVHEFDIQVWDDGIAPPRFVNLGHSGSTGFYRASQNQNLAYGNSFDTWNPHHTLSSSPPFRAFDLGPDGVPGRPGDDDGDGVADEADEAGTIQTDDERPLKAIKIRLRYHDKTSDRMKQQTIILSLVE